MLALTMLSAADKQKWLNRHVEVPSFQLTTADFSRFVERSPSLDLAYQLSIPQFASATGKRLFFQPNFAEKIKAIPPDPKERKQPVVFKYGYADSDTITYKLPLDFAIESLPQPVKLDMPFGRYETSLVLKGDVLTYTRLFQTKRRTISLAEYPQYVEFMRKAYHADQAKAVLVRK
jgi:hypothetical protein